MRLGGYRNKLTGQVYFHALCQTDKSFLCQQLNGCATNKTTSWAQTTAPAINQKQQTNRDEWTQYSEVTYFQGDKSIVPKEYQTAAVRTAQLVQKVIVIQKYWRGHNARQFCRRLKLDKSKLEEQTICQMKLDRDAFNTNIHQKLLEGRFNTKKDFDLLNHQLSEWKQEQMVHMMNNVPRWDERGRRVAMQWVIDKEAQMIALIGQHKQLAAKQKKQKMTDHLLTMVNRPKKWILPSGREVIVLTPAILHIQQITDIYYRLIKQPSSRIDVLKQLIKLLNNVDENAEHLIRQMIEEIQRLVFREIEMAHSKPPIANGLGLRLRLHNLLLRYIFIVHLVQQTQKSLHTKIPWEESTSKQGRCWKCGRYRQLASKLRCQACQNNEVSTKVNDDVYSNWLRELQKREQEISGERNGPTFILKTEDIKYLAEKIWMRKSALSGVDDLNQLQLCRWNINEMWSPWNNILLTRDEAWLHHTVVEIEKNYDPVFIRKVRHRQMLGLQHFSQIRN